MRKLFSFVLIIHLGWHALRSQNDAIHIGEKVNLTSKVLNEERELFVALPENYELGKEKYPIFYVLDAEWSFPFATALVNQLVGSGDMPKMIIVGITNSHRNRDLTPLGPGQSGPGRFGGAKQFLQFITNEVDPYIEKNFRTQPYKLLSGHSFGGLFAIYSMMEEPGFFQAIIALSPSLGRNDEQQVTVGETFFNEKNEFPKSLYLGVGNEGGATYQSAVNFKKVLDNRSPNGLNWKFEHLAGESHSSIPIQGLVNGLKYTFENYNPERQNQLDEIFLVEAHYEKISEYYGFPISVPENYYLQFAREQIAERELEYALYILNRYQEKYPNSVQLILAFVDTYLLQGDFSNAKIYLEQLEKMVPENNQLSQLLTELKK